jgi:glycerol-3-phosphate acyltransferase PlsY
VLDALKGLVAVLLSGAQAGHDAALFAGLGAVLGHLFPVWLGFRGGKGVATSYGVLFAIAWPVGLVAAAIWLVMAKFARISSLAALSAFAAAPIAACFLADRGVVYLSFTIAVLVYVRHHANIRRLLAGTEPRIGQKEGQEQKA